MVAAFMLFEMKMKASKDKRLDRLCIITTSAIEKYLCMKGIRDDLLLKRLNDAYGRIRPNMKTAAIEDIAALNPDQLHKEIEKRAEAMVIKKQPAELPRSKKKIAKKHPRQSFFSNKASAFRRLFSGQKKNGNHDQQDSGKTYISQRHGSTEKKAPI